jgi:NADH dehydrogenase
MGQGKRRHVVIVGGGFAGLNAAKGLADVDVDVTLVDRTNHHLFQPLLYQVATASLSPADIAAPIRSVLSEQQNARVLYAEVRSVDLANRRLVLEEGHLDYDLLVLAMGAVTSYFGHDDWAAYAPGLKTLNDALSVRERMLLAFEAAERETDAAERERQLTFVVIGGGPTGVEMAGAFAELARFVLARDFRAIDARSARVVLVERGARVLATFATELSESAEQQLASLGVEVKKDVAVARIDASGVHLEGGETLRAATVLWGAGVSGHPLGATLGVPLDRAGRVLVGADCALSDHPEVYVIGDAAACTDDKGVSVPGLCPAAIQQGHFVAEHIARRIRGEAPRTFTYVDKGTMATIGRSRAIAQLGSMRMTGFLAWLTWMAVHVLFLIGFRNRFVVMFQWMWQYVTWKRGARLITGHPGKRGR